MRFAAFVVVGGLAIAGCSSGTGKTPAPSSSTSDVTTVASTSTAAPTTTTTIDTSIKVYGDCQHATVEPSSIVLTCADAGDVLDDIRWTSWTAASATGVAIVSYNDCTPDCAGGHRHSIPDTHITLSKPVRGASGQLVWSVLERDHRPPGYATGTESLPTRPI